MGQPLSATEIQSYLVGRTIGKNLICLDQVDSTNLYLQKLARNGALDGTAVLAERQTDGRGSRPCFSVCTF